MNSEIFKIVSISTFPLNVFPCPLFKIIVKILGGQNIFSFDFPVTIFLQWLQKNSLLDFSFWIYLKHPLIEIGFSFMFDKLKIIFESDSILYVLLSWFLRWCGHS